MASNKKYKCLWCEKKDFRDKLPAHISRSHKEMIPEGMTPLQVTFHIVNKHPLNWKKPCRVCGEPCDWDEKKGRYNLLCDKKECHEAWAKKMDKDMGNKKGTNRPTQSEEGLKKMLASRKISGKYKWSDGKEFTYCGSYERATLEFMDKVMEIKSEDIMCPGPVLEYMLDGVKHLYITDIYYIPYNLIIEVKDGGNNPNTNPEMYENRRKKLAKEKYVIEETNYNYIRLTNKDFSQLMAVFADLKMNLVDNISDRVIHVNEAAKKNSKTKIYYGLTEAESKKKQLTYNANSKYTHKGVNTTLKGLKKFIIDNNMQNIITKYTVLDISNFDVDESVYKDDEYDMISVKIPFTIPIDNVHDLNCANESALMERSLYSNKDYQLFHGAYNGSYKVIENNSPNNGKKYEKIRTSSFWFLKEEYAAMFATGELLQKESNSEIYILIDNDMKCLVNELMRDQAEKILKNGKCYIYSKTVSGKYITGGQGKCFPEYTLEFPVKPDNCREVSLSEKNSSVKYVSEEYIQDIIKKYKTNKMYYGSNLATRIIDNIIYDNHDKIIDAKKIIRKYNEALLVNKPDIYYNKDKFESGDINLCAVVGLSGSGKSTLAHSMEDKNTEVYEYDDVCWNENFTDENLKEYGDLIYSFFTGYGKKYRGTKPTSEKDNKSLKKYYTDLINDFTKYAISYAKSHKNKRYVIEGVELLTTINPSVFDDYAVYIKRTSIISSNIRAAKRDSSDAKGPKRILSFLSMMMNKDGYEAKSLDKDLDKWVEYFEKKEESMNENMVGTIQAAFPPIGTNGVYVVNYMQNNAFSGKSKIGVSDTPKFEKIFCTDNEHLKLEEGTILHNSKYNTYYTEVSDRKALFEYLYDNIGNNITESELYSKIFGHKLYVDNQIQLEDSAIEYEDINYINKMIESSIVNYITGE